MSNLPLFPFRKDSFIVFSEKAQSQHSAYLVMQPLVYFQFSCILKFNLRGHPYRISDFFGPFWTSFLTYILILGPFLDIFTYRYLLLSQFGNLFTKGEFCSKYKEIYSSSPIIFDTTESFTESCIQTLFTALSKRLSCVK